MERVFDRQPLEGGETGLACEFAGNDPSDTTNTFMRRARELGVRLYQKLGLRFHGFKFEVAIEDVLYLLSLVLTDSFGAAAAFCSSLCTVQAKQLGESHLANASGSRNAR
jgi:hypothetical protein